jgi:tetratricopeptide (TPR) repeat protein
MHAETYNQLAYLYDRIGNFEKSIWAINQYIELAPGDANPYDSRGDLYAYNGDLDNAIASYQKAAEIKPDLPRTLEKTGNMYVYKGQYDKAEAQYKQIVASDRPDLQSRSGYCRARIPFYQGRLRDGLAALDSTIAADEKRQFPTESYFFALYLRALALTYLQRHDLALKEARRFRDSVEQVFPMFAASWDLVYAEISVKNGRVAEADSLIGLYESVLDTLHEFSMEPYHSAKGSLELAKGDPETACRHLEIAHSLSTNSYEPRYWLAKAYLMSRRVDDAIAILDEALERFDEDRIDRPVLAVRGYYLLGTAYQQAGRNDEAIEQYRTFLEIWKDADPELEEVSDAKRRLQDLGAGI